MTEAEKLLALKAMVGGSDTDEVLSTYLMLAGRKIINRAYPYDNTVTEVPVQYDTLQVEIAAYMLNKRVRKVRYSIRRTVFRGLTRTLIFQLLC